MWSLKCWLKCWICVLQLPNKNSETELLLNAVPDRIGHGTFLHPDVGGTDDFVDRVSEQRIPIGWLALHHQLTAWWAIARTLVLF